MVLLAYLVNAPTAISYSVMTPSYRRVVQSSDIAYSGGDLHRDALVGVATAS